MVPFDVREDQWYSITTTLNSSHYFSVTVDGSKILDIPVSQCGAIPSNIRGSWGFAPYQDQAAYIKDVSVFASNGSVLYQNAMTSEDVLGEYGVAENTVSISQFA